MSDKTTKIIGIAVIVAIIIFGIFWFSTFKINRQISDPGSTSANKIENFQTGQAPRFFPTQIPIETGAKITESYNATSTDGRVQATIVFESSKSVSANFKLYNDYISKNGWEVLAKDSSKTDIQIIVARNSTGVLSATIHKSDSSSRSIVDLSFLLNK